MKRSVFIVLLAAVVLSPLSVSQAARAEVVTGSVSINSHRYATQTVVIGSSVVMYITDHQLNKVFVYKYEGNVLHLRETVNLLRAGQPTIEIQETDKPTTRPAK